MIETLKPPRSACGGEIVCDGCDARLRYAPEDLHPWPTPASSQALLLAQLQHGRVRRVANRSFFVVCPHCQTELLVTR